MPSSAGRVAEVPRSPAGRGLPRAPAGRVVPGEERAGHVSRPRAGPHRPSPETKTTPPPPGQQHQAGTRRRRRRRRRCRARPRPQGQVRIRGRARPPGGVRPDTGQPPVGRPRRLGRLCPDGEASSRGGPCPHHHTGAGTAAAARNPRSAARQRLEQPPTRPAPPHPDSHPTPDSTPTRTTRLHQPLAHPLTLGQFCGPGVHAPGGVRIARAPK